MAGWKAYVEAMHASGTVKSGAGLQPRRDRRRRCASSGGKRQVQDGPFADTKEQLGGFFVIDVPDLDTALDLGGALRRARRPAASRCGR